MEIWKPIVGFDDRYEVSNQGRVRSLIHKYGLRVTPKVLSPFRHRNYLCVYLRRDGIYHPMFVHRAVAESFVENPLNYPQVNHKDENKENNNLDNLEWCTPQYNSEYSLSKTYMLVSPLGESVEIFNLTKFCRENNLTRQNICKVLSGVRSHHKGWTSNVQQ